MHLLQFYADSLETSQMFRSLSEDVHIVIPAFFFRKKGYINFCQSRSVVSPCVRPSVTFLVNVSPPKRLDIATSNFVAE